VLFCALSFFFFFLRFRPVSCNTKLPEQIGRQSEAAISLSLSLFFHFSFLSFSCLLQVKWNWGKPSAADPIFLVFLRAQFPPGETTPKPDFVAAAAAAAANLCA
jgi:hypothetical protein